MLYLIAAISVFATLQIKAQSIKRQSIASNGSSALIDGISIQQTIGQSYFTAGYYDNETGLRPGFQQFSKFRLKSIQSTYLNLNVYPNPAAYSVTIQSEDIIKDVLLQVTDLQGKLIFTETIAELATYHINCESWQNGIYFITLCNKKNKYSSKLIITK